MALARVIGLVSLGFLVFGFGLAGCGVLDFDIEEPIPEQVVPGSPLGGILPQVPLFDFPLTIDIESKTKAQGTGPAQAAHLKSVTLSITAPSGETFDFLDSITITISASGQPDREVARLSDIPPEARISLEIVKGVDLLPYVKSGATMSARATGHSPKQEVRFNGKVVVTIEL